MSYLINSEPQTILVVDDIPNNLQLLFQCLKKAGYKTLIAQSGQQALKTAKVVQPSLILLDVMMNEIDGFATCDRLKSDPRTKDIPIIFMTALAETKNKVKGFELGAVDYITKPIDNQELLARISTHLSLQKLNQRLSQDIARQKLLFKISDRIRRSLKLKTIIETATKEIRSFFNCDLIGLFSLEDERICLEAYSSSENLNIEFEKTLTINSFCRDHEEHQFYLQGNIKVIEAKEKNHPSIISSFPTQAGLIAPILIEDNTLWGWLIVDQYKSSRQWLPEEINLLQQLTTQLAIGIKQGLLYQKLSEFALLDPLTHVYNRRYFDQQFNLEWRRLQRIHAPLSLIMCDIDYFKLYNDTYGHQQGDECLQQVAKAIATVIKRPGDILARYGGEEFIILLPHTHPSGAMQVAESIRVAVQKLNIPHVNSLVASCITVSLGVASTTPNSKNSPDLLIEAADLALYQAKRHGRNNLAVYSDSIYQAKERQELENAWVKRIRQALKHNLFSLYAQPITPLAMEDGTKHFEVLLRLRDKDKQVISPHAFLDVAERNFLMVEIDTWVINDFFKTLATKGDGFNWQNHRFSINLSGASLNNESFMDFLCQKLRDYHLPPHLFCFEITETVAISNLNKVANFIHSLKNCGCSFALDDFGKGMSSLSYLQNLPVDYLKIDGSFIKQLNKENNSKIMVEGINYIAKGIGLKTIAEFVENQTVLDTVRELKVDYAQGFHLGRPRMLIDIIP